MARNNQRKQTKKKQTRGGSRVSTAYPRDVESMRRRNTVLTWVLLGIAVLLMCIILIPGESVWRWIHSFFLGMFGYLSFCIPVLLGYIGVMIGLGKSSKPRTLGRTILILGVAATACSIAYAFQYGDVQHGHNFFSNLGELYMQGISWRSAGLFSGLIGIPVVALCGAAGAKIITVVLFAVLMMILTGVTILQVGRAIAKPTKKVADGLNTVAETVKEVAVERRAERRAVKAQRAAVVPQWDDDPDSFDIPLDGDVVNREKQRKVADEARTREAMQNLKRAFRIPDHEEPNPASPEEPIAESPAPAPRPKPVVQEQKSMGKSGVVLPFDGVEVDVVDIPMDEFEPVSTKPPVEKETSSSLEDAGAAAAAEAYIEKMKAAQTAELNEAAQVHPTEEEDEKETYRFPPMELLKSGKAVNEDDVTSELQDNGQKLVDVLKSFGVQTRILDISRGPAVTRYELQPAAGVKISKITNLSDDIAMNLAASGVRIEAPIPGKAAVGVEVPNRNVSVVKMRELVESAAFQNAKSKLTVALGRDISGQITLADLAKMPHLLIAGATGSGKSVCINSLIISLLYKANPDEVKLLMVDPKVVELGIYNGIPHLLVPVVTDPRKAAGALGWAVTEMLNRYKTFADNNVRDLHGYNEMVGEGITREDGVKLERMPQIVIIIDELADLMMAAPNEVEDSICRLAQMARAAGMHLVIATQRPSVDVITGVIKANIPSRIAFAVSSQVDSRTILDGSGAEKLLGRGDMLFAPSGTPKPVRVQGCFVEDKEVEQVVDYVKKKHETEYDAAVIQEIEKNAVENNKNSKEEASDNSGLNSDPMMMDAIQCVVEAGQASTSLLQRRLRLGYARAGRLIDEMEQMGIVGPHEGSKPRQVLMTYQQYLEMSMQKNDETNDAASQQSEN